MYIHIPWHGVLFVYGRANRFGPLFENGIFYTCELYVQMLAMQNIFPKIFAHLQRGITSLIIIQLFNLLDQLSTNSCDFRQHCLAVHLHHVTFLTPNLAEVERQASSEPLPLEAWVPDRSNNTVIILSSS